MTTAAIYTRISQDAEDRGEGVARQADDCHDMARAAGYSIVREYQDNDLGASTRSRTKVRPAYNRMLKDAQSGTFDVILAYSNSRLTRRPAELEDLIRLHEQTAVRIETKVSGRDDLSTADGRMVARIKASVDAGEVERTAERVARRHLENARNGVPVAGTRPFGWKAGGREVDQDEAELIREAATALIEGVPVRQIVRDWNAAGVRTSRGAEWSPQTFRQMIKSPRLAGWRIHQRQIAIGRDGEPVRGQWTPILSDETHAAVLARFAKPEGRSRVPRRGARQYLLTGTLRCGTCNRPMYGNRAGEGDTPAEYGCKDNGHVVGVSGRAIESFVDAVVTARLAREDLATEASPWDGAEQLTRIEQQITELMDAYRTHGLSATTVFPQVSKLEEERDSLLAERDRARATAVAVSTLDGLTADKWASLDVHRRRAIVEALFSAVIVRPATRRGNTFDSDRVDIIWRAN